MRDFVFVCATSWFKVCQTFWMIFCKIRCLLNCIFWNWWFPFCTEDFKIGFNLVCWRCWLLAMVSVIITFLSKAIAQFSEEWQSCSNMNSFFNFNCGSLNCVKKVKFHFTILSKHFLKRKVVLNNIHSWKQFSYTPPKSDRKKESRHSTAYPPRMSSAKNEFRLARVPPKMSPPFKINSAWFEGLYDLNQYPKLDLRSLKHQFTHSLHHQNEEENYTFYISGLRRMSHLRSQKSSHITWDSFSVGIHIWWDFMKYEIHAWRNSH